MNPHKYQKDIESLLDQALDETKYCNWDMQGGFYTPVCFWSHQIAEKSLKALWLYYKSNLYPFTHHLEKGLLEKLILYNNNLEKIRQSCQILDQYYIPTRYGSPSGPTGEYDRQQAEEAFEKAKEIVGFVQNMVI